MKIHTLLFSREGKYSLETSSSLELLKEAAKKRGHELEVVHGFDCQLEFIGKPRVLYHNSPFKDLKILLVRANFLGEDLDLHVSTILQFEHMGVPVVNDHLSVMRAKNKVRTLQILKRHNIPTPKSYVIRSSRYLSEVVEKIHSYPVILKTITGSHGLGVSIAESERGLRSIIEMLIKDESSAPLIVQQYIKESSGKDLRIIVVGGKIVAAMERIAQGRDEFRSNFSLGGRVRVAELTKKERQIARSAVKAMGLEIAGVDIIRTKDGPQVLEVNCNPGLSGITQATGLDVAGRIIDYTVEKVMKK